MKLEFDKNGMLPEEILEQIRGKRNYRDMLYPYAFSYHPAKWRLEQKREVEAPKTVEYYFVVDGFAPELLRNGAWRRIKHYNTQGKKNIKCPYCGGNFDSVDISVKITVYRRSDKSNVLCSNFTSCGICNNEIGILKATA